jgi:pimeloyl-ACP methyl ester carboxylesterase
VQSAVDTVCSAQQKVSAVFRARHRDEEMAGRRTGEDDRADIRKVTGFRACGVDDAEKAAEWLAGNVCKAERRHDRVRMALLNHVGVPVAIAENPTDMDLTCMDGLWVRRPMIVSQGVPAGRQQHRWILLRCYRDPVLHGEDDQVIRLKAGRATAAAITGARLVTYPGMGHDLLRQLWPSMLEQIRALAFTH